PDRRAVLLLDEPGLSLHGRQQRAFRDVLTRLGQSDQLVFTTHSPFLVGGGEVGRVRVVEVADGEAGTKVRTDLAAEDPGSLVPLRQAIVYDLAQSLLGKGKVLLLERVTDYWYIQATAALLADAQMAGLGPDLELVPIPALARLVYLAPDLELEGLEMAALLDTDASGPHAEAQQVLVERLGVTRVLRTKDVYEGPVPSPTVEELLRPTLLALGADLGWHVGGTPEDPSDGRPVTEVLAEAAGPDFSPRRLAKAYVEWAAEHRAADLRVGERVLWMAFLESVDRILG
ncbi:MAG: ATP-binding protein, partial [Acidobacteriota bacterium]|nr:ATP-binding protein [Acidobacteriota bacterium]